MFQQSSETVIQSQLRVLQAMNVRARLTLICLLQKLYLALYNLLYFILNLTFCAVWSWEFSNSKSPHNTALVLNKTPVNRAEHLGVTHTMLPIPPWSDTPREEVSLPSDTVWIWFEWVYVLEERFSMWQHCHLVGPVRGGGPSRRFVGH